MTVYVSPVCVRCLEMTRQRDNYNHLSSSGRNKRVDYEYSSVRQKNEGRITRTQSTYLTCQHLGERMRVSVPGSSLRLENDIDEEGSFARTACVQTAV